MIVPSMIRLPSNMKSFFFTLVKTPLIALIIFGFLMSPSLAYAYKVEKVCLMVTNDPKVPPHEECSWKLVIPDSNAKVEPTPKAEPKKPEPPLGTINHSAW